MSSDLESAVADPNNKGNENLNVLEKLQLSTDRQKLLYLDQQHFGAVGSGPVLIVIKYHALL